MADVLRFLSDAAIPLTNNQAEVRRAVGLDPAEDQRPTRSEDTTRHRYDVRSYRSYASTAVEHCRAVFTAIRDALAGNPWILPVPAGA